VDLPLPQAPEPPSSDAAGVTPGETSAVPEPVGVTPGEASAVPEPAGGAPDTIEQLWRRVTARPEYAAEYLALAAVRHWGPPIARHTDWLRARYPHATPVTLARYAQRRQVRRVGYAALLSSATGLLAPAGRLAALVYCQGQLVLGTAAAFGLDPADPQRAAELVTILGLRPDLEQARRAVAEAADDGRPGRDPGEDWTTEQWSAGWRLVGLAGSGRLSVTPLRLVGARLLGRGRLATLPWLVAAVSADTASVERTARRADTFYRARH
jgi:hypothetical protein